MGELGFFEKNPASLADFEPAFVGEATNAGSEEAGAPAGIALALARRKWQFVTRWRLGPAANPARNGKSRAAEESGPSWAPLRRIFRATGGPVGRKHCGPRALS